MTVAPGCSRLPPESEWRLRAWLEQAPGLVAESLKAVRDPLPGWLHPGPDTPPMPVAAALARALLPPESEDPAPVWLRTHQGLSFRRALAAVRRYNGVLLADGVGTGKTWVALAVARALDPGRPVQVLAPAALSSQWRQVAARAGVPVRLHSHETLSRGRLPAGGPAVVIVDESHRFRTPATRRYQTLAPWCVGKRGIMLSATPAVNRLEDVVRQLLLFVRDSALAWSGVPSLLHDLRGRAPTALAHLVVSGEDRSGFLPERVSREVPHDEPESSVFWTVYRGILGLELSQNPVVASLVRVVLLQALASSPPAASLGLSRYRGLLLSARDAGAAGVLVSRHAIRRLVGADADQMVLWPLVAEAAALPELAISDLEAVGRLVAVGREWDVASDAKLGALARAIADRKPTLVFTTHLATVRHLRAQLAVPRIAWCTGREAGLGPALLPRDTVLDWFRRPSLPTDALQPRPALLIATDVAAEGLDLPLVTRVVHYDLPWTAVRLDQRSGRAVRLGSVASQVEVVRIRPPPLLDAALGREAILDAKAMLPRVLGLGAEPNAPWRVRARVAAAWRGVPATGGTSVVSGPRGFVAGFRINWEDGESRQVVVARTGSGWIEDAATIAALLERARNPAPGHPPDPGRTRSAIRALSGLIRIALRGAHGAAVAPVSREAGIRSAIRRLLLLAREAGRRRSVAQMRLLSAGLGLLRRGHSAGETRLAERWTTLPERELFAELARLLPEPAAAPVRRIELIGVLLMEPDPPDK